MIEKKRGDTQINPRYRKIIRSMLLSNFVLNLNNAVLSSELMSDERSDEKALFNESFSVTGFCG